MSRPCAGIPRGGDVIEEDLEGPRVWPRRLSVVDGVIVCGLMLGPP